jgi:hypothetical protein
VVSGTITAISVHDAVVLINTEIESAESPKLDPNMVTSPPVGGTLEVPEIRGPL